MDFKIKTKILKFIGLLQILLVFGGGYLFLNKYGNYSNINSSQLKENTRVFKSSDLNKKLDITKGTKADIIIIPNNKTTKITPKIIQLKNGEILDDYFKEYKYVAKDCTILNQKGSSIYLNINSSYINNLDSLIANNNLDTSNYQITIILY